MADRVASDHPSIETARATVTRRGGTSRLGLELPASITDHVESGVGRVVLDGTEYRAPIIDAAGNGLLLAGAYPNARQARDRSGADVLDGWMQDNNLSPGRTVAFDVIVPGFRYGIRLPSESAVYDTSEPPNQGLQDIAENLDG